MEDSPPTRRTLRERKPNKKYSVDAFQGLNILGSDSEADAEIVQQPQDTEEDEDFAVDKATGDDDVGEGDEVSADEGSGGAGNKTPVEDFEDAMSYASSADGPGIGESPKSLDEKVPWDNAMKRPDDSIHSRGLPEPAQYGSKDHQLKYLFGTDPEDIIRLVQSRDKWAQDITLPSRRFNGCGSGVMGHTRHMEAMTAWDWYYEHGGREWMLRKQDPQLLSLTEARRYLPQYSRARHKFLMGPYGKQQVFELAPGSFMRIGEAWVPAPATERAFPESLKSRREGWMLNVGAKVRCLDWAPNQNGNIQYLAVATNDSPPTGHEEPSSAVSAFTPGQQTQASIQIWAFRAAGPEYCLDSTRSPELVRVLCTDWGHLRQLKWCPVPRTSRGEEIRGKTLIGLLAGIWSDGHVRVIDIELELDRERSFATTYVKYRSGGFASKPPNTICTCVTWLSASELAVGCANGFVAIWNIAESIALASKSPPTAGLHSQNADSPSSEYAMPRPIFYQFIHQSYILAIVSAYPDHPHFLATTSMDGYTRLTDLRAPSTDFILSQRSRLGGSVLDYHEPLQAFISSEENDFVRVMSLRRFFSSLNVARVDGQVLSVAVGKFHPCVLVGCADGTVIATNPMRRVLHPKTQQFQQIWFQHEWTRKGEGMSRITEGYKLETANLMRMLKGDKKIKDGVVYSTIHEAETGVTQVAWNSNLRCGGWAAAGMGSGLLRVEDLAL